MKTFHLTYRKREKAWGTEYKRGSLLVKATYNGLPKRNAIRVAVQEILKSGVSVFSLKIHRMNGTIEEERTYPRKSDPTKTKG